MKHGLYNARSSCKWFLLPCTFLLYFFYFCKVGEDGKKITLTSRGLYCEQLRHLLTVHNGRIPQGLLLTIYLSEFRHPVDQELLSRLHKKPIRYASHVVHLAAEFFVVWAPTGRPYPETRAEKQSRILPDERAVTVTELAEVPEVLASLVNDPLPPTTIGLDSDEQFLASLDIPLASTDPLNPVTDASYMNEFVPSQSNVGTNKNTDRVPPDDDDDVIKGLDHGEFAGLTHQAVLEQMQNEMKNENDTQAKLQRMGAFIDYFGELSELELQRVDGPPVPKPRKFKTKSRLAIQFPGSSSSVTESSTTATSQTKPDESSNLLFPKTSPILGDRKNGGKLDCLPQSDAADGVLNLGMTTDWEQQLVNPLFGVNDTYGKEGCNSAFLPSEWPSFK